MSPDFKSFLIMTAAVFVGLLLHTLLMRGL